MTRQRTPTTSEHVKYLKRWRARMRMDGFRFLAAFWKRHLASRPKMRPNGPDWTEDWRTVQMPTHWSDGQPAVRTAQKIAQTVPGNIGPMESTTSDSGTVFGNPNASRRYIVRIVNVKEDSFATRSRNETFAADSKQEARRLASEKFQPRRLTSKKHGRHVLVDQSTYRIGFVKELKRNTEAA